MEINTENKPREFTVGLNQCIKLKDCASVYLNPDEQVTFVTKNNKEYDVCCKNWGFYATPSVNGRLAQFGFKTVLVENSKQQRFVWLVEEGKENLFYRYLHDENHRIVQWLSEQENNTCICGQNAFSLVYTYDEPPPGEMYLNLNGNVYHRKLLCCQHCGHFIGKHQYNFETFYQGRYVQSVYQDKLKSTFERITRLPETQSDNVGRVNSIIQVCQQYFGDRKISVLDVGSGLCVFLYLLSQKTNWILCALDPDPAQANHAKNTCQIDSICVDFKIFQSDQKFDLITFNKVLEHVKDPVAMLRLAKNHLSKKNIVYIELPDGTEALKDSPLREEFFVEHYHAFSIASLSLLVEKAGFIILSVERLKEPSGKYTLRAFCYVNDVEN